MTILEAYRVLADAYPEAINPVTRKPMKQLHGKAKLRALATVIQSDADLAEALTMLPDESVRSEIRRGLVPLLAFTPQS